jgi:hypothetical protein
MREKMCEIHSFFFKKKDGDKKGLKDIVGKSIDSTKLIISRPSQWLQTHACVR